MSSAPLSVGAGPFWYMRTIGTMRAPRCVKQLPGIMHRCASTVWFDVVMSTETWVGTDGTMRERSVEVSQRFASSAGRARWLASDKPVPVPISIAQGDALDIGSSHFPSSVFGDIAPDVPPAEGPPAGAGPVDVGDGLFSYRQLLDLPVSGPAVLARIEQAWTGLRRRSGAMLLRWHSPGAKLVARADLAPIPKAGRSIEELLLIAHLDAAPVPTRVRLVLFHAAAALPDATITSGQASVTVSASSPHWQRTSFTFNPRTGELTTGLPMDGGYPDVPGPASTVVAQGPVDSITALPNGLRPTRGVGAPPLWPSPSAPPAESVSPAVGGLHTVFTVLLAATPGEHAHPAPKASMGLTGSAGTGIYHAGKPAFDRRGIFLPGNQGVDPCLPRLHCGFRRRRQSTAPARSCSSTASRRSNSISARGARAVTSSEFRRSQTRSRRATRRRPTPDPAAPRSTSRSSNPLAGHDHPARPLTRRSMSSRHGRASWPVGWRRRGRGCAAGDMRRLAAGLLASSDRRARQRFGG